MALDTSSFGAALMWVKIGRLSRPALGEFAKQFYLQVVEFPRAVSALHSRCPRPRRAREAGGVLYEEETGRLSNSKPHPELITSWREVGDALSTRALPSEPTPSKMVV